MNQKESYYAALERQRAGETTIRDRFQRTARTDDGPEVLESLYTELGMKAYFAFANCLEWVSQLGSGGGVSTERIEEAVKRAIAAYLDGFVRDLGVVRERIDRMEQNLAAVEAGMRRIDKFTLEAFRNIQEIDERIRQNPSGAAFGEDESIGRGRLPKEDAARLALDAARRMKLDGRRLTLASVAREAGLKYGQIVYAFGNKEGFLKALNELDTREENPSVEGDGTPQASAEPAGSQYHQTATA